MTRRQMKKHPFLVKKMEALILISLSGQRFVDFGILKVSCVCFHAPNTKKLTNLFQSKKNGSLQILSEYYQSECPERGSTITFHPLEHLHPVKYHRPDEAALHTPGSAIDLRSCSTSLEFAEVPKPNCI